MPIVKHGGGRAGRARLALSIHPDHEVRHDRYHSPNGRQLVLDYIYYAVSISFFLVIFCYYWTGIGGPTLLAMTLVPVVFVLFTLQALRDNDLYPALPPVANYVIAFAYCAFSFYCAYYMNTEYMALGTRARRRVEHHRPDHGRRDDAADHGICAQAPHAAVHPEHRAHSLRGLRQLGARHVLSCGPELGAPRHREQRRGRDRHLLPPAADRAHHGRLVPAGAEPAARLRLHRVAAARHQARRLPLRRTPFRSRR